MFEHSVKVPRHYKIAANIFKKVSTEGGSVKTLLYDDKLRHFRTNVLFALITETIKHATQIDKIIESSGLLAAEPRFDPWLAKVLIAEILYGKKALPGKSKPEQTILSYKDKFQTYINENGDDTDTKVVRRPRYVRINTNLLTTSDAIRAFQDEGYKFIRCTSGSYDDYLQQIQNLTEYDFTQDYHVKTIFVFSFGTKFHDHELYYDNKIILQDKATAMAVHLLAPPADSVILDMCAAPGMKTTQVAAYIRNQGKIYAVERNEERYGTLCDFVNKSGSKCVETLHKDALELKRGEYDDVEYILLDPSCSGSGMQFSVHKYVEDTRLARLTSLQEKFLKHAMNAFPKAKRIVYSTCSLYPEENERVVTNVVKTSRAKWRVQDVKDLLKGNWNNFGSGMYGTMGARCLYAKPETDFTSGFFMAVLDRDQNDMDKHKRNNAENEDRKYKNNTNEEYNDEIINNSEENTQNVNDDGQEIKPKVKKNKRKKDKDRDILESDNIGVNNDDDISGNVKDDNAKKSKKKKKRKEVVEEQKEILDISKKNKKKRKIESNSEFLEMSDITGFLQEKKKKIKTGNTEDPEFIYNSQVSDSNDSIKKKKKKSKTKNNADSEFLNISQISDSIDLVQEKKKKSKTYSEFLETIQVSDSIDLLPKKKKKSKTENNTDAEFLETIQVSDSIDLSPKKNKKSKTENNTDAEFLETILVSDSIDLSPKKKKKSKTENNTDAEFLETIIHVSDSIDLVQKKKKKSKTEKNTDAEFLVTIQVSDSIDLPPKKKKKMKTETNEDAEFPNTSQVSDSNDLPRKKKKKVKSENRENPESLDIDHSSNSKLKGKTENKEDFIHLHFDHVIGVNDLPQNIKKRRKHVN